MIIKLLLFAGSSLRKPQFLQLIFLMNLLR